MPVEGTDSSFRTMEDRRYEGKVIFYSRWSKFGYIHCSALRAPFGRQEVFFQIEDCQSSVGKGQDVTFSVDLRANDTGRKVSFVSREPDQQQEQCKKEREELQAAQVKAQTEAENFFECKMAPPCVAPGADDLDQLEKYYNDQETFYKGADAQFAGLMTKVNTSASVFEEKKHQCAAYKGVFETKCCSWHMADTEAKCDYEECRSRSTHMLESSFDDIKKQVKGRQNDPTAVQYIICFLDVIISSSRFTTREESIQSFSFTDKVNKSGSMDGRSSAT